MDEAIERAWFDYDKALDRIKRQAGGSLPPIGARRNAERMLAITYQQLVKLGVMPQIRGKYRRV